MDTLSKPPTSTKARKVKSGTAAGTAVPSAANRLIVRNLPFHTTEQDLRAVFLPYGPIYSIHIPMDKEEEGGETSQGHSSPKKMSRSKGFAFVWMLSKMDAEKAIEGCNGTTMRAGTAESLVLDKQKRKKQKRLEKKLKAAPAGAKGGEGEVGGEAQEVDEVDGDRAATERVMAVDWALSKERWEEEKAKIEQEQEDVEMRDVSASEDDDDDDESEEDNENLGVHEEGSDGSDEDLDRDEDVEEPVKPTLPPPETGTTLFIRNVPFNATEDELRTLCVFHSLP